MTVAVARSRGLAVPLRAYLATLVVCSALYFIRPPEISIYIFDIVWIAGLLAFPDKFLRMPRSISLALVLFALAMICSIVYVILERRPLDPGQALVILLRFSQMVICANFFFNCARSQRLEARDFVIPALLALLIPLWGGLALYWTAPDLAIVFDRYAGYFGNPNSLSLFIVVSTPIFFALLRFGLLSKPQTYTLMLAYLASAAYSLTLAGSNSGLLLFLVVLTLSFVGSLRGAVFMLVAALMGYLTLTAIEGYVLPWAQQMVLSDFAGSRRTGSLIISLLQGSDFSELGSQSYRFYIEDYLFGQQFADTWRVLWGLGPGQSKSLTYIFDGNTVTIHNFYKAIFLEFGILGTISFALLAILTFKRFPWKYETWLLFSGFLLASLGTPVLYLPFFWAPLFAALAALTMASHRQQRSNDAKRAVR